MRVRRASSPDCQAASRFLCHPARRAIPQTMDCRRGSFDARRIALVKPSALGDVVQTLPALAALRERFPAAHISWIVNSTYASLLDPISILDEVIPFDRAASAKSLLGGTAYLWRFLRELRERRFDFVIDLQGLLRTGVFSLATGARRRWGLRTAREGSRLAYTRILDDSSGSPAAVDRYWKVAEALGVGSSPKRFPLGISLAERAQARDLTDGLPRPWIAIQPGARWETKRWPSASFSSAVQAAIDRVGGSAIVLGGKDEIPVASEAADRIRGPVRNLAGKTSLRILAALLEQCDAMLTNDTGPMHLAAAVGTPVTAVFTCTSPLKAGPFGPGHRIVQTEVVCRESYVRKCPKMVCMDDVTTDRVAAELVRTLAEASTRRSA
jgi:heptosyltransferase I